MLARGLPIGERRFNPSTFREPVSVANTDTERFRLPRGRTMPSGVTGSTPGSGPGGRGSSPRTAANQITWSWCQRNSTPARQAGSGSSNLPGRTKVDDRAAPECPARSSAVTRADDRRAMRRWWNWKTHWSQKPAPQRHEGSTPSRRTSLRCEDRGCFLAGSTPAGSTRGAAAEGRQRSRSKRFSEAPLSVADAQGRDTSLGMKAARLGIRFPNA